MHLARAKFTEYLPLAVMLTVTLAVTYVIELARSVGGVVILHELMNAFMGTFFVLFALPKMLDLAGFAHAFAQYDGFARRSLGYAKLYPFMELALGIVLLSNWATDSVVGNQLISVIIMVLMGTGFVSIVSALRGKKDIHCACLGTRFPVPLSGIALLENGLMFIMSTIMLLGYDHLHTTMIALTHMPT